MRVLLTGATGFVGSRVVAALVERGHEACVLVRPGSDLGRLPSPSAALRTLDRDSVLSGGIAATAGKVDAVVHLATVYGRAGGDVQPLLEANLQYPARLLEHAVRERIALFVNTDSYSTKGEQLYSHLQAYCLSKKQFLEWSRVINAERRVRIANMRLEHVYGPQDARDKFTRSVIRACLDNQPRLSLTAGAQQRDFVYVDDVAAAYAAVLESREQPPGWAEYEVGSGAALSLRQWVETAHGMIGSKTELGFGDLPYRDGEIMRSVADTAGLRGLGWQAATPLREGLRQTIDWERAS